MFPTESVAFAVMRLPAKRSPGPSVSAIAADNSLALDTQTSTAACAAGAIKAIASASARPIHSRRSVRDSKAFLIV